MPNQNECDHVVGIDEDGASLVCVSDIVDGVDWIACKEDICPDCGAKIDWEAIKEACDENNE